jgi:hypothetical protein
VEVSTVRVGDVSAFSASAIMLRRASGTGTTGIADGGDISLIPREEVSAVTAVSVV